jgi:Domain of unknown function DUF87.
LIVFGIFITEKYFTKPIDVIVNILTLLIVLLTLDNKNHFLLYWPLFAYSIIVAGIAFLSFFLIDDSRDKNHISQKIAKSSAIISGFLGSSRMLFSIVFILSLFSYFIPSLEGKSLINSEQVSVILLIIFWGFAILIEPIDRKLIQPFFELLNNKGKIKLIGKIAKRINPGIFYVEQSPNSPTLNQNDVVFLDDIKNSHESFKDKLPFAIFISKFETDSVNYLQFCSLNQDAKFDINKQNYIFKYSSEITEGIKNNEIYKNKENIIGFVSDNSDIDIIKIRMIDGVDEKKELREGDLLSVNFYKNATKYQIINVETDYENIDGQSRKGIKIISAQQIGYWKDDIQRFSEVGWVPDLNSPVFLENSTEQIPDLPGNYFRVGNVPRSKYPIYIDLDEGVSHHIAIIGKTGTGKSSMAAKIIEKMANNGCKVVIFEVDRNNNQSLSKYIDTTLIEVQNSTSFNLGSTTKNIVSIAFQITAPRQTSTGQTNTVNLSDDAAGLIDNVIAYQTSHPDEKICVVMEEAYDFIPENSFGSQGFGQPSVSRISQQVLKCRKHSIGFLIITQRTALVTKTILYQCHTIVALQSFDETSKNFMGAYISNNYLDSMSILPKYRAIVVGKGSTCDRPVIVDFFRNNLGT